MTNFEEKLRQLHLEMAAAGFRHLSIHRASTRLDPTRTLTLRNRFEAQMKRRFVDLKRAIRRVVVDEDSFNLNPAPGQVGRLIIQANFFFPTSEGKKNAFMAWLKQQEDQGILETIHLPRIGQAIEPAWTDTFIKDSYQRGVQRARYELTGAGYPVPTLAETGGLVASMSTPFHIDRLGAAYSRAFDQLKGITADMDAKISHILAQGLTDGDNPLLLARKMVAVIDGTGAGTLAITDSLGRFIPAERRARMLARTEVVRAHHLAMIQEYENWAVEGVKVVAEWVTAGFKVCPQCQELARSGPYTLEKIKYMIPAHPHCRCVAIPEPVEEKGRGRAAGPAEEVISELTSPTIPSFVPSSSLKEAESWAINNGLTKTANYKGTSLEFANIINETMSQVLSGSDYQFEHIGPLIDVKKAWRIKSQDKKSFLAVYSKRNITSGSEKSMFSFSKTNAADIETINKNIMKLKDRGLMLGVDSPKDLVFHEIGHFLDHIYGGTYYGPKDAIIDAFNEKYGDSVMIAAAKRRVSEKVGSYIWTNNSETFAECYRLWKTGKLPDELSFVSGIMEKLGIL